MKNHPSSPGRRLFLRNTAMGAILAPASLALPGRLAGTETGTNPRASFPNFAKGEVIRTSGSVTADGRFSEAARDIPVAGRSDVLVVGGGPAGIGAALAAARAGVKTQLIESAGCLG